MQQAAFRNRSLYKQCVIIIRLSDKEYKLRIKLFLESLIVNVWLAVTIRLFVKIKHEIDKDAINIDKNISPVVGIRNQSTL